MILDSNQAKAKRLCEMGIPSAFEAQLYFYGLVSMSGDARKKILNITCNVMNSTLAGMTAQLR